MRTSQRLSDDLDKITEVLEKISPYEETLDFKYESISPKKSNVNESQDQYEIFLKNTYFSQSLKNHGGFELALHSFYETYKFSDEIFAIVRVLEEVFNISSLMQRNIPTSLDADDFKSFCVDNKIPDIIQYRLKQIEGSAFQMLSDMLNSSNSSIDCQLPFLQISIDGLKDTLGLQSLQKNVRSKKNNFFNFFKNNSFDYKLNVAICTAFDNIDKIFTDYNKNFELRDARIYSVKQF